VMSCGGLPAKTSCSFTTPVQVPGTFDVKTTLTIATTASHQAAVTTHLAAVYAVFLLPMLGLVLTGSRQRGGVLCLMLLALILLPACGGGGSSPPQIVSGTAPGSYTVTVTAATSGFTHSSPVTLVVK